MVALRTTGGTDQKWVTSAAKLAFHSDGPVGCGSCRFQNLCVSPTSPNSSFGNLAEPRPNDAALLAWRARVAKKLTGKSHTLPANGCFTERNVSRSKAKLTRYWHFLRFCQFVWRPKLALAAICLPTPPTLHLHILLSFDLLQTTHSYSLPLVASSD